MKKTTKSSANKRAPKISTDSIDMSKRVLKESNIDKLVAVKEDIDNTFTFEYHYVDYLPKENEENDITITKLSANKKTIELKRYMAQASINTESIGYITNTTSIDPIKAFFDEAIVTLASGELFNKVFDKIKDIAGKSSLKVRVSIFKKFLGLFVKKHKYTFRNKVRSVIFKEMQNVNNLARTGFNISDFYILCNPEIGANLFDISRTTLDTFVTEEESSAILSNRNFNLLGHIYGEIPVYTNHDINKKTIYLCANSNKESFDRGIRVFINHEGAHKSINEDKKEGLTTVSLEMRYSVEEVGDNNHNLYRKITL